MARLACAAGLPAGEWRARVRAWLVGDGDRVEAGEPALEIETRAGTARVALSGEGVILQRLVAAGDYLGPESAVAVVGDERDASAGSGGAEPRGDEPGTALAVLPPQRLTRAADSEHYVDRPLSPEAQRAAARATSARVGVPCATARADASAGALLSYCERLNRVLGVRGRVRVVDLAVKAAAVTLRRVPELNAAFLGDAIRFYTRVRVGVATLREDDVVCPGIADADLKTLGALAEEARALEDGARARQLSAEDLVPPPVSVCDLGDLGVDAADISASGAHTALLSLGRVRREPVVSGERVVPGHRIALALSCDERVVSAQGAARFLGEVVTVLERPESLAL